MNFWGVQYREKLILNVTVFVVRVWGEQYRDEPILNVTGFVVRVWGGQYREELILNFFFACFEGLGRSIYRGTDTEGYCVGCECLERVV